MARPRNQDQRRRELLVATSDVVARKGIAAARLSDIAAAAGITPGAVLYYYESLDDLFFAAYERGIDRFCREREEAVAAIDAPADQLRTAVHLGIPRGPEDTDIRLLYEFESVAFRSRPCAALMHGYVERQTAMYAAICDLGRRSGDFALTSAPRTIARNLIALEDGLGIYVLTGHRRPAEIEALVLDYAATSTGTALKPPASGRSRRASASPARRAR
jgi:AcrR family transcriptional regulator